MFWKKLSGIAGMISSGLGNFFGRAQENFTAVSYTRIGLGVSGGLLIAVGLLLLAVEPWIISALSVSALLIGFGLFSLISSLGKKLTVIRANKLSLIGSLTAVIALYIIVSRILIVTYTTDTVVGTLMGVLRILQLQSPYGVSIKPLMDQFGFSPSFYTPGVDGSFDFHIAYPSLSFMSLVPFYVLGIHDIRDTVFIFFLLSILILFGLSPAKFKSVSLAPFGLFPVVIAGGWTDSVWAFFLVLTAILWYRSPKASWVSLGLAVATKQVAIVIAPFLLIRFLHENPTMKVRRIATSLGLMLAAFMVPNLPFIIASPGAWWKDIVAPYLPNSPAQVPGGIGLSNILLDLGVALPSSFFLVLTLGVSTFLLYAYARHFRGLNSMVFGFPVFIFFLYYRSFPNYMAYWVFPMVLEFATLGGPNIRRLASLRIPTISWRPSTGTFLKIARRRLTPSVMILMALAFAFVGVSGAFISDAVTQKATIQINGVSDPDSIGSATMINVTLRNLLATPVSPSFFVKWSFLPYVWTSSSASLLASGAQTNFVLNAPDAISAVPRGDNFHIVIYDKLTGQLLGESGVFKADTPIPPIANPGLKWWTLDSSVGKKVPFGWKLTPTGTDLVSSGISPLGVNGTSGLQLLLNYTTTGTVPEALSLSQPVLFNDTAINVQLTEPTTFSAEVPTFAASVSDGTHLVYYVFSNRTSSRSVINYGTNTTVTIPVDSSIWNNAALNPVSVWTSQGWAIPQQVTMSIFLSADSPGVYSASVLVVNPP